MAFDPSILLWIIPLAIWDVIWKGIAMWRAAKRDELAWFIIIFVVNTLGILPIIYLAFFAKKR